MYGGNDENPPDLATMTFFQLVNSNRGVNLMKLLSLPEQPSPQMWGHFEAWFLTSKVSSLHSVLFYNST